MVCLAATTWAWFTASVTSYSNTIQTASFGVEVYLDGSTTPATVDANGNYALATGTHTIKLKPTGNATKGFVVVEVAAAQPPSSQMLMLASAGDGEGQATPTDITAVGTYCTQQLFDENGVAQVATFTIQATGDVALTVKAYWGEKQTDLVATPITATLTPLSNEAQLTNEEEDPVDEEPAIDDEQETPDDTNTDGEGESNPETPAEGEGNNEQQSNESTDPADGEEGQQGGETPVEGQENGADVGDNTGDDIATGGETPADTTTTGDDVTNEPVVTTDPTAQGEGTPTEPVPTE